MSYIDKEAFIESQRHLYCENCEKRKGMKNGKIKFVYEIGDAPCRACGYGDVIDGAEDFPEAELDDVEVKKLRRDLKDCRNELCLRCGDYKQRHLGACDGCRWRADNG